MLNCLPNLTQNALVQLIKISWSLHQVAIMEHLATLHALIMESCSISTQPVFSTTTRHARDMTNQENVECWNGKK